MPKRYKKQCQGCKQGTPKNQVKRTYLGGHKIFLCGVCLANNEQSITEYIKADHLEIRCALNPSLN